MLLGVSTIDGFYIVNLNKGTFIKKYNKNCYGFTFNKDFYFLKTSQEPPIKRSILIFNKTFDVIDNIDVGSRKIECGHQMQYHKPTNQLWMPCPGAGIFNNDIFIYSLKDGRYRIWTPIKEKRRLHYNSICFKNDLLHVLAHNYHVVPSILYTYNWKTEKLLDQKKLKYGDCHNIFYINNDLYYCASVESKIMNIDGSVFIDTKPDKGIFLRGIALNDKFLFVGSSPFSPKQRRKSSGAKILVYNIETRKYIVTFEIPKTGAINEIRILDDVDHAHTTGE